MILRRVVEHVKAQQWTAIFVDFVIVVVGVFIGIQVSNWNEERIERKQEREMLVRLHEDIEESIAGQERDLRFLDRQLSDQAVMLKSLDACEVTAADQETFQRGVNTLGYINPPRLSRRTIDEMASSGRTDIIRSDAIKEELAAILALAEWRSQGFDQSARTTEHYRYIVEERVRYDLGRTFKDEFMGDFVGVIFDIKSLCANPAAASAISAISQGTRERRNAYAPILERYRAFLPLLEEELRTRWGATRPE